MCFISTAKTWLQEEGLQSYFLYREGVESAWSQISIIALVLRARKNAAMPVMCILQPFPRSPSSLFLRIDEVGRSIVASSHLIYTIWKHTRFKKNSYIWNISIYSHKTYFYFRGQARPHCNRLSPRILLHLKVFMNYFSFDSSVVSSTIPFYDSVKLVHSISKSIPKTYIIYIYTLKFERYYCRKMERV
jgi:hypothetical protein